jgi:hypothetical protein
MLMELLGSLPLARKSKRRHLGLLDHLFQRALFEQKVGQSDRVGDVQDFVQRGTAQVRIDHQDALAVLGEDGGQIEQGGGFAFARAAAQDGNGVPAFVLAREQEIGAQNAVGFGMRAFRPFIQDDPTFCGMTPKTGACKERSTSSMVLTLVSRYSMKKARPRPTIKPTMTPKGMMTMVFGLTGALSGLAGLHTMTTFCIGLPCSAISRMSIRSNSS